MAPYVIGDENAVWNDAQFIILRELECGVGETVCDSLFAMCDRDLGVEKRYSSGTETVLEHSGIVTQWNPEFLSHGVVPDIGCFVSFV